MNAPVQIQFSIGLSDGSFHSELKLPIPTTKLDQDAVVGKWLDLMASAFRIGATEIDAVLKGERP